MILFSKNNKNLISLISYLNSKRLVININEMIDLPFNTIEFAEVWQDYLDNKKEEYKFEYRNERTMKAALKKLERYAHGNENIAIAILENSIAENWRGFFPLDKNDPLMIQLKNIEVKPQTLAQKMRDEYDIS